MLRDHSHSDFCRSSEPQRDVLLLSWLTPRHRFRSLRTLRHPLDSWLALVHVGWHTQFQPSTLLEYCPLQQAFLYATDAMPQLHYEDFCTAHLSGREPIGDDLLLPFDLTTQSALDSLCDRMGYAEAPTNLQ